MPQLLPHIDQIARKKQRNVLTVEFHDDDSRSNIDYQYNESRETVIAWLTANDIPHYPCGQYASETRMMAYRGQIYIDVPFDESDERFQRVVAFLENSDGTVRLPNTWFHCYTLEQCMRNAHHDAPGFWDTWAEKF
jgi:hypothetical protein